MWNLFRITDNTFKESVREPVYFLMLLCAVGLIAHFPSMALFVFSDQLKLVVDSAMATCLLFGLLAAILCASHTVAREMRNGTVLLLLSKPVFRWTFVLGKIFGILLAVLLFTTICATAAFVSVYVATDQFQMDMGVYFLFMGLIAAACVYGMLRNYFAGASFGAAAVLGMAILIPLMLVYCIFFKEHPALELEDLAFALLLINFAAAAMATIAVVFATRLDVVANLCVCSCVFFVGLVSNYLFLHDTGSAVLNFLGSTLYAIFPNWQYFWLADAIATQRSIPGSYVLWAAGYVGVYMTLCAAWAVALFQNKEIAGDTRT